MHCANTNEVTQLCVAEQQCFLSHLHVNNNMHTECPAQKHRKQFYWRIMFLSIIHFFASVFIDTLWIHYLITQYIMTVPFESWKRFMRQITSGKMNTYQSRCLGMISLTCDWMEMMNDVLLTYRLSDSFWLKLDPYIWTRDISGNEKRNSCNKLQRLCVILLLVRTTIAQNYDNMVNQSN